MRSLFLTALAAAALASATMIACDNSDDKVQGASNDGGTSTEGGSSNGDVPPAGDDDDDDDEKPRFSPTGCALRGTGLQVATSGKNDPTSNAAAIEWSNIPGAYSEDGDFAKVVLEPGQQSQRLYLGGFGFNLPLTPKKAEVWGIVVQLKRRALGEATVKDIELNMVIEGGAIKPQGKKFGPDWPKGIVGTHDYGNRIDTWLVDTKPEYFNDPNFAIWLAVERKADDTVTGPQDVLVDSMKIELWFCPDPDIKAN